MRRWRTATYLVMAFLLALMLIALIKSAVSKPSPLPSPSPYAPASPSPAPSPVPSPPPSPSPSATAPPLKAAGLELPVAGASGYASVSMKLRENPDSASAAAATLEAGTPFQIAEESGEWFRVASGERGGWLRSGYCLVNLPDVVPSIVYDATNTYASIIHSSGFALPGITGKGLYPGKRENARLGEAQFIMPVLYPMAKKIFQAQQLALANGETLVVYEAYRPYDVQMTIVRALSSLASENETVMKGISSAPWTLSWFASTKLSNHQRGGAIDVSLAKVEKREQALSGAYGYTRVTSARRYEMPTPMHELSQASAALAGPVSSKSRTAWRQAAPAPTMNDAALRLQNYCVKAGLTPLASEWWHFNDLDALEATAETPSSGRYTLSKCLSAPP